MKRIFDVLFASLILALVSPILLTVMILIKRQKDGPIFFLQERLGKHGRPFDVIKLRTMTHKKRDVHVPVYEGDPDVTRLGAFLRRSKIDELLQFVNVLLGDMSVVGPRPCLPVIRTKYRNSFSEKRFDVKPGVTSLAGVKGSIYLNWDEKFYYDKIYAENVSFANDIRIILKTILVVFLGEKRFYEKPVF